ncbi:MAG: hypothetical protein LUO89_15555, partial [Methanothrix sp.]|nr:hypothetical protein [Methanothrix sp.]
VHRLLISALWLAGCSALVALLMYLLGAPEIAVIELSVGAGLVTVLFVFAINIAGEEVMAIRSLVPRPLSWLLVAASVALLTWITLPPFLSAPVSESQVGFAKVLWQDRWLDLLLQIVLIFAGVLGVIGLLADEKTEAPEGK